MVSQAGQIWGQGPEEEKCLREGNSDTNGKPTLILFLDILLTKQRQK
jgi:hypothetical protein